MCMANMLQESYRKYSQGLPKRSSLVSRLHACKICLANLTQKSYARYREWHNGRIYIVWARSIYLKCQELVNRNPTPPSLQHTEKRSLSNTCVCHVYRSQNVSRCVTSKYNSRWGVCLLSLWSNRVPCNEARCAWQASNKNGNWRLSRLITLAASRLLLCR